jgi:hypothetical protein
MSPVAATESIACRSLGYGRHGWHTLEIAYIRALLTCVAAQLAITELSYPLENEAVQK